MSGDIKITSRYGDGDYLSKNEDWHVADSPWKAKMLKLPKKILYKISPKLMSILVGGSSLMILAKLYLI